MKIVFIDNSEIKYNSKNKYNSELRGAETVIINMAESLADLDHEVYVINNCPKDEKIKNVNWLNINKIREKKSSRWVGCMVADVHRTLMYGGV